MMNYKGWEIPEGKVVKVEDEAGRVIWMLKSGGKVILEVEKITSDTYAGGTTYTGEQFILLDIYPKTNGTVKVTYGGLTKTIKDTSGAAEPNAQQVFFGTFNGVADSVETPASGTLTIEGGCIGVGIGSYNKAKASSAYCDCVTAISEWGGITEIPDMAFYRSDKLFVDVFPEGITHIGHRAFFGMYPDTNEITLPSTIESFYASAFSRTPAVSGDPDRMYLDIITILATTPPSFIDDGIEIYKGHEGCTLIVVPKGCSQVYKLAEDWVAHSDIIVEEGLNTFTINDVQYEFAARMTFGEWIASVYNTAGFTSNSVGTIYSPNGSFVHSQGNAIDASHRISPSIKYEYS